MDGKINYSQSHLSLFLCIVLLVLLWLCLLFLLPLLLCRKNWGYPDLNRDESLEENNY